MRTAALACLVGLWAISSSLLVASGLALRAASRRRLVLGSRIPGLRQEARVLEGREALRVSIGLLTISLALAFLFLATAIVATIRLSRALAALS